MKIVCIFRINGGWKYANGLMETLDFAGICNWKLTAFSEGQCTTKQRCDTRRYYYSCNNAQLNTVAIVTALRINFVIICTIYKRTTHTFMHSFSHSHIHKFLALSLSPSFAPFKSQSKLCLFKMPLYLLSRSRSFCYF